MIQQLARYSQNTIDPPHNHEERLGNVICDCCITESTLQKPTCELTFFVLLKPLYLLYDILQFMEQETLGSNLTLNVYNFSTYFAGIAPVSLASATSVFNGSPNNQMHLISSVDKGCQCRCDWWMQMKGIWKVQFRSPQGRRNGAVVSNLEQVSHSNHE